MFIDCYLHLMINSKTNALSEYGVFHGGEVNALLDLHLSYYIAPNKEL